MNTSKLILSFSCGKVNFFRSILLFKRGFYMSEEIEVACLLCLSDDKLSPETFWAVCQMTNCPQRRFKPFVRWQIVPRDVLSHLSDDKSFPEAFWDEQPPPPQEKWRFERVFILEFLLERVFLWIATLTLAMTGESPLWLRLVPSLNFISPSILRVAPLLEERNRRGFSSVA